MCSKTFSYSKSIPAGNSVMWTMLLVVDDRRQVEIKTESNCFIYAILLSFWFVFHLQLKLFDIYTQSFWWGRDWCLVAYFPVRRNSL